MSPIKVRHFCAAIVLVFGLAAPASSQGVRYAVEPKASLAWWQVDPHYGHLWATTCPDDPNWQPGEGRSPGYYIDYFRRHQVLESGRRDARIPLYPRKRVRYLCRSAVVGQVDVADTISWRVTGGQVSVLTDSLVTGLNTRDAYARRMIFQSSQYPALRFTIDSLTNRQMSEDTIVASAVGTFELRGIRQQIVWPVRVWKEGGGLRVQGHFQFPARDLVDEWQISKQALGMGVMMGQWKDVHMGVDLLLMRVTQTSGM